MSLKKQLDDLSTTELLQFIKEHNATSDIHQLYAPVRYISYKNETEFDNLTSREKKIILRELTNDYYFDDDDFGLWKEYYTNITYIFTKMSVDNLPTSAWEGLVTDLRIHGKDFIKDRIKNLLMLEKNIYTDGYNNDFPITLAITSASGTKKMVVSMGNHRLQAVRNLIKQNRLPSTFKIPTLILIEDEKLRDMIREKDRKLRGKKIKRKIT